MSIVASFDFVSKKLGVCALTLTNKGISLLSALKFFSNSDFQSFVYDVIYMCLYFIRFAYNSLALVNLQHCFAAF